VIGTMGSWRQISTVGREIPQCALTGSAQDKHHAQLTSMASRPLLHRQINVAHDQSSELEPAMEVDNLAGRSTDS
jgi:hypothetical protein